jgi:hypothetical protein
VSGRACSAATLGLATRVRLSMPASVLHDHPDPSRPVVLTGNAVLSRTEAKDGFGGSARERSLVRVKGGRACGPGLALRSDRHCRRPEGVCAKHLALDDDAMGGCRVCLSASEVPHVNAGCLSIAEELESDPVGDHEAGTDRFRGQVSEYHQEPLIRKARRTH